MNSNFTGAWKADLEKSRFLSPPPRGVVIQIDHAENYLREEIIITKNDSLEERVVFTCDTTGNEGSATLNGKAIRGKSHWVGSELVIESWMQFGDRELYFRDCWSLRDEGQTLIMEHRDDALAGQLTVLRRMEQETGRRRV